MPFDIVRNDITNMQVDVIVNSANIGLKKEEGVCGAIFERAGWEELQRECDLIGNCNVGEAVITSGYKLKSKYIIHTVGPMWKEGNRDQETLLYNAYMNSLKLAKMNNCRSIAFPLISTGVYGYPKEDALKIATNAIRDFLLDNYIHIYLVVYDKNSYRISRGLFKSIIKYIDDNYVFERRIKDNRYNLREEFMESTAKQSLYEEQYDINEVVINQDESKYQSTNALYDVVNQLKETFSQSLLRLIDEKGMTDVDTYKRANIDRKLFSKIRGNINYNPKKTTVLSFAIALKLNLNETLELLGKAGYTLANCSRFDVIIKYFIENENYNIFEINEALFQFDEQILK